ncbi:unnamed protein product [Allacma fusca]|uniref:Uncharacterized protein n=1 Tax=Allacma fusca TaxID=39272 RepID=A0A8J2P796_9HEXA|nr:unnamed protein product [Allacma fusca]
MNVGRKPQSKILPELDVNCFSLSFYFPPTQGEDFDNCKNYYTQEKMRLGISICESLLNEIYEGTEPPYGSTSCSGGVTQNLKTGDLKPIEDSLSASLKRESHGP